MIVDRVPYVKEALLVNANLGRPTLHKYHHAEIVKSPELAVSLYYRCQETGDLRTWGLLFCSDVEKNMAYGKHVSDINSNGTKH